MNATNTFELIFNIQVEKFEGKIRAISKAIKIDGVEINSKYDFRLSSLIDCLYIEGNHDIFTCQCGDPGCAGIDDGVHVSFDKDLIHWQVRDPMSTSGYENYDAWNATAKTIRYSFNKEAMIHNISEAIDSIKNRSHNSAEFLFNLNIYLT